MAKKRRRNPTTFFHEHPWMTFFLGGGALYTLRVIFRGWDPAETALVTGDKPAAAATPVLPGSTTTDTSKAISGLMGLYR